MSLIFIDGFDHYGDLTNMALNWPIGTPAACSLITGRFGAGTGSAFQLGHTTQPNFSRLVGAVSEFVMGFAFKVSSFGITDKSMMYWAHAGEAFQCALALTSTGQLRAFRGDAGTGTILGTSTAVMVAGQWHYIEARVKISATVGTFAVKLDGVSVLALTGQNTKNSATADIDTAMVFGPNSAGGTKAYDDMYFCDVNGSVNNDFLGDCRVKFIRPTANGANTDFVPNTGNAYDAVDDTTPDGDATYISSSTVNHKSTFVMEDLGLTDTVKGISVVHQSRKDDATVRELVPVVRLSGTDYDGPTNQALTTSYDYYEQPYDVNPATSAAWTRTEINGMEAGVKVKT